MSPPTHDDHDDATSLGVIPTYPTDVLPKAARSLVSAGETDGLPAALLRGAALAALAAVVGAGAQLEVTRRWHERAILWIPLMAPRGAGKSPAQELAFRPIGEHDAQLADDALPVLRGDMTLEALLRILKQSDGTAALDVDELATFVHPATKEAVRLIRERPSLEPGRRHGVCWRRDSEEGHARGGQAAALTRRPS